VSLDILQDSIGHPSLKLLWFAISTSFYFPLPASMYITRLNKASELKFIVLWISNELSFSISSVSIYYGAQLDIRVKSYCRLNLLRASVFNFEHHDIIRDSTGHSSLKLLWFAFSMTFCFPFRASWYNTRLNKTSELNFIVVWVSNELSFSISSVSIYYGSQSDIRVKGYCRLNLLRASVFNFKRLKILRGSIGHPS